MTHGTSAARAGTNGLAVASLVCGIVGLLFFNVILGPLAIVLGAVALRGSPAGGASMAKAGIALGIVDLVIFTVLLVAASSSGGFSWYTGG